MRALESQLKADFPTLFELGCSCDIADGWMPILRRLCDDLQHQKELRFTQIKEKFGGLRIYTSGSLNMEVYKRLNAAEEEAFKTCERCGDEGRLARTDSGWQFTTCQLCLDGQKANGRRCDWAEAD